MYLDFVISVFQYFLSVNCLMHLNIITLFKESDKKDGEKELEKKDG